ncbi:DNRLRE domain-containing protein (plasmid) [Paenibacillus peoriae]|uniref:DNRLRE domain-containing protein n=1 Tax=Paenibacillus peoriae TaxID=59893 RepID=A0A7H0YH52_9BACL|nr:DNRLRE domain-containing protein [Paenibacillus peoriae]QNR70410.1 DNRLRE domain-containing protein [Paenibacillus peoriae]
MSIMGGLIFSLHASLADKGLSRGINGTSPTSQWYDLSGKGNHGSLSGFSYESESGWTGKNTLADPYALYFNGFSNHVDAGKNVKPPGDLSFEAWFYYVGGGVVLSTGGQDNNQGFAIVFNENSELELHVKTATKSAKVNLGPQTRTKWYHVAGTFDSKTGFFYAFLNGAPAGRGSIVDGGSVNAPTNLTIGKHQTQNNGYFRGAVVAVRVYDRALSMDEVGRNYLDGYLFTETKSDQYGHIVVPERKDLRSSLRVSIATKLAVSYGIKPTGTGNMLSSLDVKKHDNLDSSIIINPSVFVRGKYSITPVGGTDLESSVSVNQRKDLEGNITIAPHMVLRAKYKIEPLQRSDVESSITVNQAGILPGQIAIAPNAKVTANYGVDGLEASDLHSSIEVKGLGNLPGFIGVNTHSRMTARYNISGISTADLPSSLGITAVNQIKSSIKVNSHSQMRAKYGVIVAGLGDLPSSLTISSVSNLKGNISVSSTAMMTATYDIMPGGTADLQSTLGIASTADLPSSLWIKPETYMRAKYNVTGLYTADLPSSLTIKETADLPSLIRISPYTMMRSSYNVIEPPTYTTTVYPNKDAFVRESIPKLNYGTEEQMFVGYSSSSKERFRSYVDFDLLNAGIPDTNATIQKAVLRVYLGSGGSAGRKVQVVEPVAEWAERGLTWVNQPYPHYFDSPASAYDGIIVTKDMSGSTGYVEFDVTEAIYKWHKREKEQYGFILKALNEYEDYTFSFDTKEQKANRPHLEITYYDTRIFSFGTSSVVSEMTIRRNPTSDLKSSMFIRSFQGKTELPGSIFVDNPRDWFSYISTNRPSLVGGADVRQAARSEHEGSISVSQKAIPSEHEGELDVSKPSLPISIYVPYRDDIYSTIAARRWGIPSEIAGSAIINRPSLPGEVGIRIWSSTDWASQFNINQPDLISNITIMEKSNLEGQIGVRQANEDDLEVEGYLRYRDDLEGSIRLHKPWMEGHAEVYYSSMIPSKITVRGFEDDDLKSSIMVTPRQDLSGSLYIPPKKDIPSSITVLSGYWAGHITVPHNATSSRVSTITVRVKAVSDLPGENGIRSGWLGSDLQVRVGDWKDLKSSIGVRLTDTDDLLGDTTIRANGDSDLPGTISAKKYREADLHMSFKVQVQDLSEIGGQITVRALGESDLNSEIGVRVWGATDQPSSIAIRRDDYSDHHGNIDVKQISELSGHIAVRRDDLSEIPGSISVWEKSILEGWIRVKSRGEEDLPGSIKVSPTSQIPSSIEVITAYPYSYIM